jgi:integrase/recombinase XerD
MNRTSPGLSISLQPQKVDYKNCTLSLSISKAIPSFIQFKSAEGLSPRTLVSYEHDLNLWLEIQRDRELNQVTMQELREYLHYMCTEYTPERLNGKLHPLSLKSIRNAWIILSSSAGGAYVNFMMDEGQERVRATYRENYDRLVAVKNKYDPSNFFHINQNIGDCVSLGLAS